MSYHSRIQQLERLNKELDTQISNMEKSENIDEGKLQEMKKLHADYFNEIRRLNRLQWEEDHERVKFDDDR